MKEGWNRDQWQSITINGRDRRRWSDSCQPGLCQAGALFAITDNGEESTDIMNSRWTQDEGWKAIVTNGPTRSYNTIPLSVQLCFLIQEPVSLRSLPEPTAPSEASQVDATPEASEATAIGAEVHGACFILFHLPFCFQLNIIET